MAKTLIRLKLFGSINLLALLIQAQWHDLKLTAKAGKKPLKQFMRCFTGRPAVAQGTDNASSQFALDKRVFLQKIEQIFATSWTHHALLHALVQFMPAYIT